MMEIKLILDQNVLDQYNKYYFRLHPRASKKPIDRPLHPSMNTWMRLPRMQMNQLKQKWKDLICWWIDSLGYSDLNIDKYTLECMTYMPTKRRFDPDNSSIKFIADGLVDSGFLVDDSGDHMEALILKTGYDKEWPRTEITIKY